MSPYPSRPSSEQSRDERGPEITVGFKHFNMGNIVTIIVVSIGGLGTWLHGDSTKQDLSEKMEQNRSSLVKEIGDQIDNKLQPFERRMQNVEECEKNTVRLREQIARLTQAIDDMRGFRMPKPEADNSAVPAPTGLSKS